MAVITEDQKGFLERAADIFTAFIVGYLVWTLLFKMPPFEPIHGFIAILGTAAIIWWLWKSLVKNRIFGD